jgi:uncharacterized RDD family membrane protein YckC
MTQAANLDTVRQIATPEGCEITLRVAGPVARAGAWLIDLLIRFVVWMGILMVSAYLDAFGEGLFYLSVFLLEWFYPILFEVFWHGKTPGKNVFGLAVVHDDGTPVQWNASFIRNTLRFADFFPVMYATGFVATLLNRDGKRLGDLVAGTVVTYLEKEKRKVALPDSEGAEPPPFPLTVDEQRALIEFRNRAKSLTRERASELASAAQPLTEGLAPDAARLRLIRVANYLLGER